MTIFRCSLSLIALLAGHSVAQAQISTDANLRAAVKAVLGQAEVRQRNTPGPGETTIIKAVRLMELPFGPVLITEVTIDNGSHAEVGALGVYYLRRVGNRYTVQKSWTKAVEGGGFGQAPEWKITTRFTKYPAIYATAGWVGQGCVSQWAIVAELTPIKPLVSDPIFTSFSYDRLGDGETEMLDGRIANIRKSVSFDVVANGTRRITDHYEFRDGRYVRTNAESALQC